MKYAKKIQEINQILRYSFTVTWNIHLDKLE
jgi:hypothetical protein